MLCGSDQSYHLLKVVVGRYSFRMGDAWLTGQGPIPVASREILSGHKKKILPLHLNSGTGCPEKLINLLPWEVKL